MTETIGFLELNSIARGIQAADAMLKAAEVRLLAARPNCPGKYNVLVCGQVSAVDAAVQAGAAAAGETLIEQLVIPRVHPQVIDAINLAVPPVEVNAVGVLEYFSITAAVLGADTAVKAAEIQLLEVRLGTGIGGKSYVILTGDTASVNQAVESGAAQAAHEGMLLARVVVPNPTPELFESLL